jgi:NADH-quinone oxidoreductase subunit K
MFFSRKHIIIILISLELLLLSININFIVFSIFLDDFFGQVFALIILGVAAAESALGLAILIIYYRLRGSISIDVLSLLKGF